MSAISTGPETWRRIRRRSYLNRGRVDSVVLLVKSLLQPEVNSASTVLLKSDELCVVSWVNSQLCCHYVRCAVTLKRFGTYRLQVKKLQLGSSEPD